MRQFTLSVLSVLLLSNLFAQWYSPSGVPFYNEGEYFDTSDSLISGNKGKYEVVSLFDYKEILVDTTDSIQERYKQYPIFYRGLIAHVYFECQKGDSALVKDGAWEQWWNGKLQSIYYYDHGVDTAYIYFEDDMSLSGGFKFDYKTKQRIYADYKNGILFSTVKYSTKYFEVEDKEYLYYGASPISINDAEPWFVVDLKKETSIKKCITLFGNSIDVLINRIEYPSSCFEINIQGNKLNFPLILPANDSLILEITYVPDTAYLKTEDTIYIITDHMDYALYCHTKACHLFYKEMRTDTFYFSKKVLNNNLLFEQDYRSMFFILESQDGNRSYRGGRKNKPPAFKIDLSSVPVGIYEMVFGYDAPATRILVLTD